MKYFIDTEFHEYKKKPLIGKPVDTIELISIGIVSEDEIDAANPVLVKSYNSINLPDEIINPVGVSSVEYNTKSNEYYAICKDFDIKAAWNSFQRDEQTPYEKQNGFEGKKVYWLRENVLYPIFKELLIKEGQEFSNTGYDTKQMCERYKFKDFKKLISKYGKTREQIAKEIKEFVKDYKFDDTWEEGKRFDSAYGNGTNNTYFYLKDNVQSEEFIGTSKSEGSLELYAYYADYDWVVFCWLFGRMIDLPYGFPMYCNDLKQILDEKCPDGKYSTTVATPKMVDDTLIAELNPRTRYKVINIEDHFLYPKQTNEHNALADAKWNKELYKFLNKL